MRKDRIMPQKRQKAKNKTGWTARQEKRFAELVGKECLGTITRAETATLDELAKLRSELHHPRPPEEKGAEQRNQARMGVFVRRLQQAGVFPQEKRYPIYLINPWFGPTGEEGESFPRRKSPRSPRPGEGPFTRKVG